VPTIVTRVRRHLRALCVAALVPLSAVSARAATPTDTLREFFARVNGVIQAPEEQMTVPERVARIGGLTRAVFDVRRAAAAALGKEWHARTPAEHEQFVRLFGDVLQRGYLALVGSKAKFHGGVDVAFIDEAVSGDTAVVRTTLVTRRNAELSITYRMTRAADTWRVVDAMIGGVSLVGNYRAQLTHIRQRSTYPELVALMRVVAPESPHPEVAAAPEAVTPDEALTGMATVQAAQPEIARVVLMPPKTPPPVASVPVAPPAVAVRPPMRDTPLAAIAPSTATRSPSVGSAAIEPKRFWVQIGAFHNSEFAARLVERLREPTVAILTSPAAGRASATLTRVCVGPFARLPAAVARMRELETAGYRAFITAETP